MSAGRLPLLGALFSTKISNERDETQYLVQVLPAIGGVSNNQGKFFKDSKAHRYPISEHLHSVVRIAARSVIPDDRQFTLSFDRLEILIGLAFGHYKWPISGKHYWAPLGSFILRGRENDVLDEIQHAISTDGDTSIYVRAQLFGNTALRCGQEVQRYREYVSGVPQRD